MSAELFLESVAKNYITEVGDENASTDWISIATEVGAVLIPLIKDCIERRRSSPTDVANTLRKRPLMARAALRNQLRMSDVDNPRAMINAIMNNASSMDEAKLIATIREAAGSA